MMLKNNKKGFLYYAHNNELINYVKLAIMSAISGHENLKEFSACIVTDTESVNSLNKEDSDLLNKLFEYIIINDDYNEGTINKRTTFNGFKHIGTHPWYNVTRTSCYDDSPYEETILIDVDFIFQDNNLEKLWGNDMPIMMPKEVLSALNNEQSTKCRFKNIELVGKYTIPMYWATVVYFDRSEFSKNFFKTVNHIQDNYFYYQKLYQVNDGIYRNDFSFSIALFLMNGCQNPGKEWDIPYKFILTTMSDVIYRCDKNQTKVIAATHDWKTQVTFVNLDNISYHCMNKMSLLGHYNEFVKVYGYE